MNGAAADADVIIDAVFADDVAQGLYDEQESEQRHVRARFSKTTLTRGSYCHYVFLGRDPCFAAWKT